MNKIQTIVAIEDILRESGLYWSVAYNPSSNSYSIFVADEDDSDEEGE